MKNSEKTHIETQIYPIRENKTSFFNYLINNCTFRTHSPFLTDKKYTPEGKIDFTN